MDPCESSHDLLQLAKRVVHFCILICEVGQGRSTMKQVVVACEASY